jgi:hypothetical protein
MAGDYLYDVFISYRHKPPMGEWVRNHFYPLLEQRLPDCLPVHHNTQIFLDWDIETGAAWPAKLRQALKTSRCLLAVWSPEYFRSAWCQAEWQTMLERHRQLDLGTEQNPSGLIYPVTFFDGEHFPPEAKRLEPRDLQKWNIPYPIFKETKDFVDFDREIQDLCKELAIMIQRAPAWQDWPVITPAAVESVPVKLPRL